MNKLILSWYDSNKVYHEKEYTDPTEAVKAKRWLASKGAVDIDLAVRIVKPLHNIEPESV